MNYSLNFDFVNFGSDFEEEYRRRIVRLKKYLLNIKEKRVDKNKRVFLRSINEIRSNWGITPRDLTSDKQSTCSWELRKAEEALFGLWRDPSEITDELFRINVPSIQEFFPTSKQMGPKYKSLKALHTWYLQKEIAEKDYLRDVFDLLERFKLPRCFEKYIRYNIHFNKVPDEWLREALLPIIEPDGEGPGSLTLRFNGFENRLFVQDALQLLRFLRDRQFYLPALGKGRNKRREAEVLNLLSLYPKKRALDRWNRFAERNPNDHLSYDAYRKYELRLRRQLPTMGH